MYTLHEDQHTFSFISRSFLLRMRNVCDKICRENQHKRLTFRFFFPPENRASYVIRWKNTVVPGRPQMMIIWLMCISRWVPKATHTQSEYAILIAFVLQQWLHERASVLCHSTLHVLFKNIGTTSNLWAPGE